MNKWLEQIAKNTGETIAEMRKSGMFITPNVLYTFVELPIKEHLAFVKYNSRFK